MPYQDMDIGMKRAPLGGNPHVMRATGANPIKNWIYKGDTKGRDHYKNMSFKTALAAENPMSSKYEGYKTGYTGTDRTGPLGYARQGVNSLVGNNLADSNISGGTTGARYLFEKGAKAAAAFTPIGRAANVGNLAYQGTTELIDRFGWKDNLRNAGGRIHDTVNKYMPSS